MRIWHIDMIPYLPKSQILGLWRELNSIFKKQDKHILINYIYDYDKEYLLDYSMAVITVMINRGYKVNFTNFNQYFQMIDTESVDYGLKFKEHDKEYLIICYYNLKEKYLRGQKDFTDDVWQELDKFYKNYMERKNDK